MLYGGRGGGFALVPDGVAGVEGDVGAWVTGDEGETPIRGFMGDDGRTGSAEGIVGGFAGGRLGEAARKVGGNAGDTHARPGRSRGKGATGGM